MEYDNTIVGLKEKEGIIVPKRQKITTKDKYIQVYESFEKEMDNLDKCSIRFALFLGRNMDEHNQIEITKGLKTRFIEEAEGRYKLNTIHATIKKLKDISFIIPIATRQEYIVNPVYMFNSRLNNRFTVAKKIRNTILVNHRGIKIDFDF